jgi:DNA-binding NarL/FixJ family response regulator
MADPIRVMVIDDTSHVRTMLRTMLELDGFEVVAEASSGPEAIDQLDGADPDVVVVDFKMPQVDGIETTRMIRELRPDQIVILYTAFLDDELERRAAEAGVTVSLGKVSGLASLELEIRRHCEKLF